MAKKINIILHIYQYIKIIDFVYIVNICCMHIAYEVFMGSSFSQQSASMRRASNRQWGLKPLDLAVLFMLVIIRREPKYTYAALAKLMMLSQFEVHASVQRLIAARLLVDAGEVFRPVMQAIREFVMYGAAYCYPSVRGEVTIGFATAYGVPPLSDKVLFSQEMPPVWPHPEGNVRGMALMPLYEKLPLAAIASPPLYELLALFDALRMGQARERELAIQLLNERLQ